VEEDALNCPDDLKDAQTKSRSIKIFCYSAGIIAIMLAFFTEPTYMVAGLIAFGATIGYFYNTSPLLSQPHLRLKNMFIIKNFSSGLGWSAGLLVFPMLRAHIQPDGMFFTAFVYMFAMVTTYEIMWDIRDVAGDSRAGIRTLPIVLGINSARIYAVILQFVCLGVIISGLANARLTPIWSLHLFPSIMLLTLIIFFPRLIRFNRGLSHVLVMAISIYACLSGALATRFG
jgi:4-hydroxybenzoate polyprenyltransferase